MRLGLKSQSRTLQFHIVSDWFARVSRLPLCLHSALFTTALVCGHREVVTISGRTIKKEAQADPERARVAIARIETLLDKLPKDELRIARELRLARNGRRLAS